MIQRYETPLKDRPILLTLAYIIGRLLLGRSDPIQHSTRHSFYGGPSLRTQDGWYSKSGLFPE